MLVIDDEEDTWYFLSNQLEAEGYSVKCAANGQEGLDRLATDHFDVVLCDVRMPSLSGLDVLKEAKPRNPASTTILMTAFGSIRSAVDAIHKGDRGDPPCFFPPDVTGGPNVSSVTSKGSSSCGP